MRGPALKSVTIRDVARVAEVSVASASRALNGLDNVTETTRERVLAAARSLRYVPHSGARSLITRQTDLVGVVLPELHGEFFSEIIRGVDVAARERGLHLLVSNSHGDPAEAAAAIRSMRGRVDGVLIMSPHLDGEILENNLTGDLPTVLMNTPVEKGYFAFKVDNHAGAFAVVRHLVEQGRRRVAHIAGPGANFETIERRRGYLEALGEHAPGVAPLVFEGDFSEEAGRRVGDLLAASGDLPDAVFAANDMMAVGCMHSLQEAGYRLPQDVAVAGFDDIPLARLVRPSLTSARVRIADLGRRALERLVAAIEDPQAEPCSEIIRPELVVRDSSASALAAAAMSAAGAAAEAQAAHRV